MLLLLLLHIVDTVIPCVTTVYSLILSCFELQTALLRQKQYMGAAGAVQGPGGNIFWAMGGGSGGEEGEEDDETEDDDGEEEEEAEEEEWDEEEDLGDEEHENDSEEEMEAEAEASDGDDGESDSMTVIEGDGGGDLGEIMLEAGVATHTTTNQNQDQEQGDEVNSISSGGFADVLEEPLLAEHEHKSSDGAMAVDEPAAEVVNDAAMLLQHSGESLPTASASAGSFSSSSGQQHQHQHHIWFHGPDSPLTTAAAWQQTQQQSQLASHSFDAPLPAPITQRADLGSYFFDATAGAQFGSLSSDLTGTTTLESASMSYDASSVSSSFPASRRLLLHRAASAAAAGPSSRPPSDERISDCTAASDGYFEGEDDEEEGEEDGEAEAQFETDELL